jgi:hypothetical protein
VDSIVVGGRRVTSLVEVRLTHDSLIRLAESLASEPEPRRRQLAAQVLRDRYRYSHPDDPPDEPVELFGDVEEVLRAMGYPDPGLLARIALWQAAAGAVGPPTGGGGAGSRRDLRIRYDALLAALAACPFNVEDHAATIAARWLSGHPDVGGLLHPSVRSYLAEPRSRAGEGPAQARSADLPASELPSAATDPDPPAATPRTSPVSSNPLNTPKDFADAYLAEIRATGAEPAKIAMWNHAKAKGYTRMYGTQRELWGYFPQGVRSKGGRPRKTS